MAAALSPRLRPLDRQRESELREVLQPAPGLLAECSSDLRAGGHRQERVDRQAGDVQILPARERRPARGDAGTCCSRGAQTLAPQTDLSEDDRTDIRVKVDSCWRRLDKDADGQVTWEEFR